MAEEDRNQILSSSDQVTTFPSEVSNIGMPPPRCNPSRLKHYKALLEMLNSEHPNLPELLQLCDSLNIENAPPLKIICEGPWADRKPYIRRNTHLSHSFEAALRNLALAGRILCESERNSLRALLDHWCGWSATYPQHMDDSYFKYTQWAFHRKVINLHPILDSVWYPEEVRLLPERIFPDNYIYFLLANAEGYYVYSDQEDTLYNAGPTLEGVVDGLRNAFRDGHPVAPSSWEAMDSPDYRGERMDHFPYYDGHQNLLWEIKDFVPPPDCEVIWDSGEIEICCNGCMGSENNCA